jgi:hypothetical protein
MKSEANEGWVSSTLTLLIAFAFVGMHAALLLRAVPAENKDMFQQYNTGLFALLSAIIGYRYGTSVSSAKKDATIAAAMTPQQAAPTKETTP